MSRIYILLVIIIFPYWLYGQKVKESINDSRIDSILLKPVQIHIRPNYTKDSLNRRKDFASVFAYKEPSLKDIFIGKSSVVNRNYQAFQPSTSSLVSVNLLSVISLIGKNKDPKSKLKKKLLKLENENYIDHIFSKEKVRSITSLQGDSLQIFIEKYRPSTGMVSQMTDYELLLYIKRSYKDFIKDEPFSED